MPLKKLQALIFGHGPKISRDDAMKVFRRDHFKCQYCGLDGTKHFENWLVLTIDHVHPHARGGARHMGNLVTACQPCNLIKGKRAYASFEDARKYVLQKREEWHRLFVDQMKGAAP